LISAPAPDLYPYWMYTVQGRMTTAATALFLSNKTQAMHVPKAVAFPDGVKEVEIVVVGESRILSPAGKRFTE
jgi:antitoxin VapB